MRIVVERVVPRFTAALAIAGAVLIPAAMLLDRQWQEHPWAILALVGAIIVLRAAPIQLSKYSYLTQTGVPVLVGAVLLGPGVVTVALAGGVFLSDWIGHRKAALF
ncbi:MAG: hypothetical protein ACHQXA_06085, partial [Gemmatimonadales bacterium]